MGQIFLNKKFLLSLKNGVKAQFGLFSELLFVIIEKILTPGGAIVQWTRCQWRKHKKLFGSHLNNWNISNSDSITNTSGKFSWNFSKILQKKNGGKLKYKKYWTFGQKIWNYEKKRNYAEKWNFDQKKFEKLSYFSLVVFFSSFWYKFHQYFGHIYGKQNWSFYFSPKFRFLTKIFLFDQNFDLRAKFRL